jgi:hypothetical protein
MSAIADAGPLLGLAVVAVMLSDSWYSVDVCLLMYDRRYVILTVDLLGVKVDE